MRVAFERSFLRHLEKIRIPGDITLDFALNHLIGILR